MVRRGTSLGVVLLGTAYVCGARAGEVGELYIEDFDLHLDDEYVRLHSGAGPWEPCCSTPRLRR